MSEIVVCFDLWNTLIAPRRRFTSYADVFVRKGVSRTEIYPFIRERCMPRVMNYEEMAGAVASHFHVEFSQDEKREVVNLWQKENEETNWLPGAQGLLRQLRAAKIPLVLITNMSAPGWDALNKKLGIADRFNRIFVSSYEGVAKPDAQVWERAESWFPEMPKEHFVMVGDREDDDIIPTKNRGWRAFSVSPQKNDFLAVGRRILERRNELRQCEKIIIIDVPIKDGERRRIKEFGVRVFDAFAETEKILQWPGWQTLDPESTLLVFPGDSAARHRIMLPEKWLARWQWIDVQAQRSRNPDHEPEHTWAVSRFVEEKMNCVVRDVVIVDDVISSGTTCCRLRELNSPWLPNAHWHAVAWLKQRSAHLTGFKTGFAARYIGTESFTTPSNSFSTLLADGALAKNYAERKFGHRAPELLALLADIRKGQR